jgi:hypothetical protein
MSQIEAFLRDLDGSWKLPRAAPLTLRVLGSTALLLRTTYQRGTKDSDVLETREITPEVSAELVRFGGKGTALHRRHGMYLEILRAAFPFLPEDPIWHSVDFTPPLTRFRVEALDVTDVCVAKLARFHGTDRDDIKAMADDDRLEPAQLVERFKSAAERWRYDARVDDLPGILENLRTVQRDMLYDTESELDLLPWLPPG